MTRLLTLLCTLLMALNSAHAVQQSNCDTLVTETRAACLDVIRYGLGVSCTKYLTAIDIAMDQAGGNLFDVGDGSETNEAVADSFCSLYVEKLRADRDQYADSMQEQTGPRCSALAERFDASCMTHLGKGKMPGHCRNVVRTFASLVGARSLDQEALCPVASMQLPQD